jgi:hypothetical protein
MTGKYGQCVAVMQTLHVHVRNISLCKGHRCTYVISLSTGGLAMRRILKAALVCLWLSLRAVQKTVVCICLF